MPAKIQTLDVTVDTGAQVDQRGKAKALRTGLEEQRKEGHQHECRAKHRVEEELERGVLPLLAAPHPDHEVHRQEHDLEEDEEENQVLRDERAGHTGLQHEHQDVERLGVAGVGHVVPRVDHHEERDAHRQEVQRQADAVKADGVSRPDHFNPFGVDRELELLALSVVKLNERVDADQQGRSSGRDADGLDAGLIVLRPEHHDERADERQERADGQQPIVVCECFHEISSRSFSSR